MEVLDVIKQALTYILGFEIPFGTVTFKPVYFIYVALAVSLFTFLMKGGK